MGTHLGQAGETPAPPCVNAHEDTEFGRRGDPISVARGYERARVIRRSISFG